MVEFRTLTEGDIEEFWISASIAFGDDPRRLDDLVERFLAFRTLETNWVAVDGGRIVATFGFLPFDLTVPGGAALAMAGTTVVTVSATHRRRGVLTELMGRHLRQAADELNLAVAGLWASDERIYRRFGFGPASWALSLRIPTEDVVVPPGPPDVRFRRIDTAEATDLLPPLYDTCRAGRPGTLSRSAGWWFQRHLEDPEYRRGGGTALRIVVAERGGEPVGYVTYRTRDGSTSFDNRREGTVDIHELLAADDGARRALWSYAAGIDLFPTLEYWNTPADDPLPLEIERFRYLRQVPGDSLWLRALDIPRLLEARTYSDDGQLVLDIGDPFLGRGGRFRLEAVDGKAQCTATEADPDITLDVADLGSLYLGGLGARELARAGRLHGEPSAVALLHRLLSWPVAPWCPEVF